MLLRLLKSPHADIIAFHRDDGSATVSRTPRRGFFPHHDLLHYAVETTLRLDNSFLALVSRGADVADFATPGKAVHDDPHLESIHTEFLVNQLHSAAYAADPGAPLPTPDAASFNAAVAQSCRNANLAPPAPLSDAQLTAITTLYNTLASRWRNLPEGESLELRFP